MGDKMLFIVELKSFIDSWLGDTTPQNCIYKMI